MRLSPSAADVDPAECGGQRTGFAANDLGGRLNVAELLADLCSHACLIGATERLSLVEPASESVQGGLDRDQVGGIDC